MSNHCAKNS